MLRFILLLVTGGQFLSSLPLTEAEEYYVTPTQSHNPACPTNKPCHTLNEYAKNASSLFSGKDNVSLLFLDGVHMLTGQPLNISNTTNLTMAAVNTSYNIMDGPPARIEVSNEWRIFVTIISILRMDHLLMSNSVVYATSVSQLVNCQMTMVYCYFYVEQIAEIRMYNSSYLYTLLVTVNDMQGNFDVTIEGCIMTNSNLYVWRETLVTTPRQRVVRIINCNNNNTESHISSELINILFLIKNSHFLESTLLLELDAVNDSLIQNSVFTATELFLTGPANVTIDECLFQDTNHQTFVSPVVLYSINIFFIGNVQFVNNSGYRGGAMHLDRSVIHIGQDASIIFANNTATDVGGALYMYTCKSSIEYQSENGDFGKCSFLLQYDVSQSIPLTSSLHFINNSAQNGGIDIYGTSLKSACLITPDGRKSSNEIQDKLFQFDNKSSLSPVSSDPTRVCLCENGKPQCASYSYIFQERSYSSGEKFNLSLVLVGDDFGTVTGVVHTIIVSFYSSNSSLGPGQAVQQVNYDKCNVLEYSIHSREVNLLLLLVSDPLQVFKATSDPFNFYSSLNRSIDYYQAGPGPIVYPLSFTPIFLNITMVKCPLAFTLIGEPPACQCDDLLVRNGIDNCVIAKGVGWVYRNGTVWVSHYTDNNGNESVLVHKNCPYGYCKTSNTAVNLYKSDKQCAFNHSGVLCGHCLTNFSLAIGSSRCLLCNNDGHVALVLVFIIAGFALVFLIKVFDFTVVGGTLNGLIFYANIIWINQTIFFPSTARQNTQVLKVFIAWLNLDFGIETCFFQGLDAYWKTWLQFVFPIYVWLIVGMIIIICHYSLRATKVFGNNSVHVLATLLLLSYVKLLRTIITALRFAIIESPEGSRVVWLFDGNLQYFGLRHSFLFVAALLALFTLWVPYTAILLFVPYLRKHSNHSLLSWVNKWKPFFDSYYGPLKDQHQYWIGVTLIVRVLLSVIAFVIQAIAPMINVLIIAIVSAILCYVVNPVYKKSYISLLEASILINLVILSGGFLYANSEQNRMILVDISVSVCIVTFLFLMFLHGYLGIKKLYSKYIRNVHHEYENLSTPPRGPLATNSSISVNNQVVDSHLSWKLRESILESSIA